MRSIKFRAYDEQRRLMIYDYDQKLGNIYQLKLGSSLHELVYTIGMAYENLMQFTGKLDQSEKDIFESDILKIGEFMFEVVYHEASFKIRQIPNGEFLFHLPECIKFGKVIGNIHENPELFEAK